MPTTFTLERDLPVPMRDGTTLRADVYRPAGAGRYPALLQRTPYDKSATATMARLILRATEAGYAVLAQDVRGRFQSDGDFHPFVNERDDGYDTLSWLVEQPWCDGRVGMYNQSYIGLTQWQAAMSGHEALRAIVPTVTAADYHNGWTYQGGAFELSFNYSWIISNLLYDTVARSANPGRNLLIDRYADTLDEGYRRLPLDIPADVGDAAPYYAEWLAHPSYDEFWRALDVSRAHSDLAVPALNIGGWYDIFLKGTIDNFSGMRANARTDRARRGQRLLIGPWNHSGMRAGNPIGDADFGVASTGDAIDVDGLHLRWYDHWLRDADNGVDSEPPVRIFVMGDRRWRVADEWPLPETDWQEWYLHSGGRANSLRGDGSLSREPSKTASPDRYLYDPRNPVPTRGGGLCCNHVFSLGGAFDQREVEAREDVLVYTTEPLRSPLEVTGPLRMLLYASSSTPDTDFTAKLVDVAPCGCARNLTDGILRARFRKSMSEETLLEPGEVALFDIDMVATSNVFLPNHRLRLEISSSNFPRFDRNPNTGEQGGRSREMATALQTVFHDSAYPSRLLLPVIPAGH
jgi:putative CocE/NonD family hydrolase